jgi:hypothetical protein
MAQSIVHHPSSYRDPSGFIFEKEGIIYRQVNKSYQEHFDFFIESGCYKHLSEKDLLISHEQIKENLSGNDNYYATLKPEKISFISYPWEWSFDMLKDAALLTLRLVKESLNYGMILKDATPFNIQWHKGKFIFVDTLSFEKYKEVPWIGYRQFCENFLGPLLIMHYSQMPLSQLLLAWPDGIPIAVVKSLLPKRSRFSLHTYLHIHLHAKIASKKQDSNEQVQAFSKQKLLNLIASLELLINKLRINDQQSTWSGYYEEASQRDSYLEDKKRIISDWIQALQPSVKTAADLGANEGDFSKLLAEKNIPTISGDFDPFCINHLYTSIKKSGEKNIQPLIIDLANPSPAIGVNNEERDSFINRVNVDITLALALVHHLAIGKLISFDKIAAFFSGITRYLIIEFIPPEDEKVLFMLSQKEVDTSHYTQDRFELSFGFYFTIEKKNNIAGSHRILYLMKKR